MPRAKYTQSIANPASRIPEAQETAEIKNQNPEFMDSAVRSTELGPRPSQDFFQFGPTRGQGGAPPPPDRPVSASELMGKTLGEDSPLSISQSIEKGRYMDPEGTLLDLSAGVVIFRSPHRQGAVNLPLASEFPQRDVTIKVLSGAVAPLVQCTGADLLDGRKSGIQVTAERAIHFWSDGINGWWAL